MRREKGGGGHKKKIWRGGTRDYEEKKKAMTFSKFKPNSCRMFKKYTQKHQYSMFWNSTGWCSTLLVPLHCCFSQLWSLYDRGISNLHHYHLREPLTNLTLIKTQSITHYTKATDRKGLEVSDHHKDNYTSTHLIISTIFSISAYGPGYKFRYKLWMGAASINKLP